MNFFPPAACLVLTCLCNVDGYSQATNREHIKFFETRIRPLLAKHCYECHSIEAGKSRGGLRVDDRQSLLRGGQSGQAIIPRDASNSLLYQSITYEADYQMPPDGKLSDEDIAAIKHWIDLGAPDPRGVQLQPNVKSEIDLEEGRQHWAYQLPQKPVVPDHGSGWATTNIDRFIARKRDAAGLSPVGDASPSVLVRRLFFVLSGLPPDPEQIDLWTSRIGGNGQDARLDQGGISELLDQLLDDDSFGERWGQHWMDVVRFAESTGGDSNNVHQHAWRYRDYVIDSLNRDKPFNEFIMQQIAGDLLPIASDAEWAENVIATGFLAVGLKLVGEEDQQKFFADLVDEQIDATTRAFLATTVACARCHDHKFDPIPQEDYYALAGIFRATETHYGLIKAQARQATTLLDLTGLGPEPARSKLDAKSYADLVRARDEAIKIVDDAMRKIRSGENVFRGTLRRIRSDRDETEAALQAYDAAGNPRVFAMGTQDREHPLPTRLLVRGEIDQPAQLVSRGVPQVLSRPGRSAFGSGLRGSGRRELAAWIAGDQNPLTARVIVNRVWGWMFGQGLVRSVDDFGRASEQPSHATLLDYLAVCFMEDDWSIKSLIRRIARSRTWQQASDFQPEQFAIDPDNRLLWRMNKRRLEGEAVRDAMLAASGNLNRQRPLGTLLAEVGEGNVGQNVFEPVIRAIQSDHRSVYLPRVRNVLPEMLELFDAPDASSVNGQRVSTATPLQSLFMLNNPFVHQQSMSLAEVAMERPSHQRMDVVYLRTLGRKPSVKERESAAVLMSRLANERLDSRAKLAAFCQVLLCTTEFSTID